MRNIHRAIFFLMVTLGIGLAPWSLRSDDLERASPGKPRFVVRTDPSWDAFTGTPDQSMKDWFNAHVWRMMVYAPFFNERLSWYPNAWIYINLYSIPVNSVIVKQHPDWILKDGNGQRLFIPYECRGGSCPQYAADLSNPAFRKAWLDKAATFKQLGYKGFWIDDVNLAFRVSDGNGTFQAPVSHGKTMSEADWGNAVASFLEEIRRTFPDTEILHNSIWFAGGPERDRNPLVKRQLAACDYVNVERGVTDAGLKGGDGEWSLRALLGYIDRVHKAGKGVVLDNTGDDYNYGLAGFYLVSTGVDALGSHSLRPGNWPQSLNDDLGTPLADRETWRGLLVRRFSRGLVLVNPPERETRQLTIQGPLHAASGSGRDAVELPSPGGLVLTGGMRADTPIDQLIRLR